MKNVAQHPMIILLLCLGLGCTQKEHEVKVTSPGSINEFVLKNEQGSLRYAISHDGNEIILPSRLGLLFKDGRSLIVGFQVKDVQLSSFDETWEQPWGESRFIRNHYNQAVIALANAHGALDLIVRAYDDGVAFRYDVKSLEGDRKVVIQDEITEFNLAEDAPSWWIKAYDPNRYEQLYQNTPVSQIDTVHTPFTLKYANGTHVSIHEAVLNDYASMQIAGIKPTTLHVDLAPWSNGDKVRTSIPFVTPWRTIKIADSAADLKASFLTLNCNPPNQSGDVSWIKPSKYIGVWWGMILGKWTWGEGFRHGATTARGKQYIDFAADNGIDEVLIEGISTGFTGLFPGDTVTTNFVETTDDFALQEVQGYALSKGVSLQAYHETSASTRNYLAQIDDAFTQMQTLGIQKAKIGQVGNRMDKVEHHYGQHGVNYYRTVLQKAVEYEVAVNFHEPIKDTGERRTFPNMLTREGARGMEYNAWDHGNPPAHEAILAFTRLLEAPMDFTPGIFDLQYEKLDDYNGDEFPVKFTVIDQGNGYQFLRYKGAESIWRSKDMTCDTAVVNGDTTYVWRITQLMQPGDWEWGVSAHDVASDNDNLWLLSLLDQPNAVVAVAADGRVSGSTNITIPDQGIGTKKRWKASEYKAPTLPRVSTTLAKQLALYVVIYSPIQMAADFIENYENQSAFQFIKDVPIDWDTTVVINGEVGEYITIARKDRNSEDWYLGSITNEHARTLDINLSFLGDLDNYTAEIYADGREADWASNPLDIDISQKNIETTYQIDLAPGGGHAVRFIYHGAKVIE